MSERRIPERTRTFLRGRITFNGGQSSCDCIVRDMSDGGARLVISESLTIPDTFRLDIPKTGRNCTVQTRWRRGEQIGVTFVDSAAPRAPSAPDAEAHIQELEQEVAKLRRILEELRADPGRIQTLLDRAV